MDIRFVFYRDFFPPSVLCNFFTVDVGAQSSVGKNCSFGSGVLVYLGSLLTDVIIFYMLRQEFENFVLGGELNT